MAERYEAWRERKDAQNELEGRGPRRGHSFGGGGGRSFGGGGGRSFGGGGSRRGGSRGFSNDDWR